jgi:hypothetical protein
MAGLTVQNFLSAATGMALAGGDHPCACPLEGRNARQFLGRYDPGDALRAAAARLGRRTCFVAMGLPRR